MSCLLRVGVGRNRLAGPPDGVEDDREKSDQDMAMNVSGALSQGVDHRRRRARRP